jgi:hypothetical protein
MNGWREPSGQPDGTFAAPQGPDRIRIAFCRPTGIGAKDNLKLVTENEVFKRDVTTRSERDQQTAEQEGEEWKHPAG